MPSERRRASTAGHERGPGWHSPSQVLHGALWEGCGTGAWPWEGEVGKDVADGDDDDGYIINIYIYVYIYIWLLLLLTYITIIIIIMVINMVIIVIILTMYLITVETPWLRSGSWAPPVGPCSCWTSRPILGAAWWPWVKKVMGISPRNSGIYPLVN